MQGLERKRPLGRPSHRLQDSNKINLEGKGLENVNRTNSVENMFGSYEYGNEHLVPYIAGNFLTS
jgi:hypothetical protein